VATRIKSGQEIDVYLPEWVTPNRRITMHVQQCSDKEIVLVPAQAEESGTPGGIVLWPSPPVEKDKT
jgi:hypothetical protein